MSDYDYIDKKNKTGTLLGQSTSKLVSFYGIQPVDQPASLTAAVSTITYVTASTVQLTCNCTAVSTISSFGVGTSSMAGGLVGAVKNVQTRIGELEDVLQEVGIIAGGTVITTTTALPFDFIGCGGGSEGMVLGCSATGLIGFWGVTPCDQPTACTTCTATAYATLITTATSTILAMDATISLMVSNSAGYGLGTAGTSNELQSFMGKIASLQTRLAEMETKLTEVGILPGGTAVTSADSLAYDYLDGGADSGTIFGRDADAKIGFWATTPCDQAAALTTAMATINYVAAVANTYAMSCGAAMGTTMFGFVSVTAGNTLIYAVQNAQVRALELEAALNYVGLQAT